jgi:hypothetical protein
MPVSLMSSVPTLTWAPGSSQSRLRLWSPLVGIDNMAGLRLGESREAPMFLLVSTPSIWSENALHPISVYTAYSLRYTLCTHLMM